MLCKVYSQNKIIFGIDAKVEYLNSLRNLKELFELSRLFPSSNSNLIGNKQVYI